MAINVYGWRKPTLELELVEGGSLLANTKYYVRGMMKFNSSTFHNCGSCMSDVYEITTTSSARSIKITQKTYRDITTFASGGTNITTITSARHCLKTGDEIKIATGSYTGTWTVTKVDANTFTIPTAYVDDVAVQCYTDSVFYNTPEKNFAPTVTAGMAYHVHTVNTDAGNYWTRRAYTDAAHANPYIVTAQPTAAFNYARNPARSELNAGIFKANYEYGCPFITLTDSTYTLLNIYDSIVNAGFENIVMYNANSHSFLLKGSIYVTSTATLNVNGFNIILIHGELHCGTNTSDKINLYNCVVNWPLFQNHTYINLTAVNSIFKSDGANHISSGKVEGSNNKFWCSLNGFNTGKTIPWINTATGENKTGVLMENVEIYDNLYQNNYNSTFFRNCILSSVYHIVSVVNLVNGPDTVPNIYTMENCYISKISNYTWHNMFYSYNVNAQHILKHLNVNTDETDNRVKCINNSAINIDVYFYRRAKFYIKNQEGIAIDNANIKIVDSSGNSYSGITDASGYAYIDCLEQFTEFINKPVSTTWNPSFDTFYTDFTITITKSGYDNEIIKLDKLYQEGYYDTILNVSLHGASYPKSRIVNATA